MADPKRAAGGVLYHVLHGESGFMYEVDRRLALANHPREWRDKPWTEREVEAYKKRGLKSAKEGPQAEAAE